MNPGLSNLHRWLKANKLILNVAKTEFMIIGSQQNLLAQGNDAIETEIEGGGGGLGESNTLNHWDLPMTIDSLDLNILMTYQEKSLQP